MPKPSEIIDMAASCMNDSAQEVYTDAAVLPYLNMAMRELQELFQLNNIPVTDAMPDFVLDVAPNISRIAFTGTIPTLPTDLKEIRQMWESDDGTNVFIPMTRKDFIPHNLEGITRNSFIIWSWISDEVRLLPCQVAKDIKLDYIRNLFALPILIGSIDVNIPIEGAFSFLGYRTASLAALYIGENKGRSDELDGDAGGALDRSLGISAKSRQQITTRRRPFMASFKRRRIW